MGTKRGTTAAKKAKRSGHSKPLAPPASLGDLARVRVGHLMSLLGIAHSTVYERLDSGAIPPPDGHDGRRPFWRVSTVRAFLEKVE